MTSRKQDWGVFTLFDTLHCSYKLQDLIYEKLFKIDNKLESWRFWREAFVDYDAGRIINYVHATSLIDCGTKFLTNLITFRFHVGKVHKSRH